jgi:hypothetical protein
MQQAQQMQQRNNYVNRMNSHQNHFMNPYNGPFMQNGQPQYHYHSFNSNGNSIHPSNGYNNFSDEQLLEGLPGDESMSRLF